MKILFANNLCGFYGGVEQVILNYARGLARRGHESHLVYGMEGRDPEEFSTYFTSTHLCNDFGVGEHDEKDLSYNNIMEQVKPDVVFFHKVTDLPKGAENDSSVRKIRMMHDHDIWCPTGLGYYRRNRMNCHQPAGWRCYLDLAFLERTDNSLMPITLKSIQRKIYEMRRNHNFDAILVVSNYMREQLLRNNFPPEKVHVCHPILEQEYITPQPVPEENNIVYIGSLIRGKGIDFLLRALQLVSCPFHLDIVGTGKSENDLRRLCQELGLENKIQFVGWVDHEDVSKYYHKAKVMAIPSCWPEPFTLVGQESMRHRRPVVAFDVGGNSNWLDHDHTGFIVPEQDVEAYAQAIERLLTDTALAQKMGENGANSVRERFPFERFLDKVEGFLSGENALENSSGNTS